MTQPELGGGPRLLRLMNCAAVLRAIRHAGAARVTELMEATRLSRPTVTAAVSTLIADGWVEEADPPDAEQPRMGRPARVLRFRADARHVLGMDVGPHKVLSAVTDLNGEVIGRDRRDVKDPASRTELLGHIKATITGSLAEAGVERSSLAGVALGLPGIVDHRRGALVKAPSLPGWNSVALAPWLQQELDCPVRIENDVNLAVMAERWKGVGSDVDDLVLVLWGSRVGAAVLVHGNLHRGAHGAAGEVGFIDLADEPAGIQADGLGPMEASIGSGWILDRYRKLGGAAASPAGVFEAVAFGDPIAQRVMDEVSARFARGLAPFLAAVDPELVIIGGGITLAGETVLDRLSHHLASRALVVPRLKMSSLGDDAVALGAVRLALAGAEQRLLDSYTAPGS